MNPEIKTIGSFERYGAMGWQWTTISVNHCLRHYRTNTRRRGVWLDGLPIKRTDKFELTATDPKDALKTLLEKLTR